MSIKYLCGFLAACCLLPLLVCCFGLIAVSAVAWVWCGGLAVLVGFVAIIGFVFSLGCILIAVMCMIKGCNTTRDKVTKVRHVPTKVVHFNC